MSESRKLELSPSVSILIAGVVIAGAIIFVGKFPAQAQPGVLPNTGEQETNVPPPSANEHIIGSPDAPIVLIEYSDFQCPFCQRIHSTLERIVEESNGEVAWVYRHFPLESIHPEARPAAVASECISSQLGNDAFWQFADEIFTAQASMSAAQYLAVATRLGADPVAFSTCTQSKEPHETIDAQALEAQMNGGSGTPYTIVWSRNVQVPISGALPYEQIQAVINGVKSRL